MAAIKGSAGSRIRLILGETGSDYLLITTEDDGEQTIRWKGMPFAICKQISNCESKGRSVKELDCCSTTGAWYVRGIKPDGTGGYSWWGSTAASSSIEECAVDIKVSFGSTEGTYGNAEEMYVIIKGDNGYSFSNIPEGLKRRIQRMNRHGKVVEFIRLFDDGGYFIKDSEGSQWGGLGTYLSDELKKSNDAEHDVAVAKDGCWVVIRDDEFSSSVDVSKKMKQELTSFYSRVKRAQRERLAREAAEREALKERKRLAREAAEREAREERERLAREAAERERIEREERERQVREAAERERIEREAREKAKRAELEEQKLVLELQEECKEIDLLEKLINRRRKDVMLRVESLPPSRRDCVMEKTTDWNTTSSSTAKIDDCVICHDNEAVRAIVPCGHHCLCDSCAAQVMTSVPRTCPLCRESVQMTLKIYRSF
jgi:hypothetical protein